MASSKIVPAIVCAALGAVPHTLVNAEPACLRYQAQVIQPASCGQILGPPGVTPYGLSLDGKICGYRGICNGDLRAFWWNGSTLTTLVMPGSDQEARARAINSNGQIVGTFGIKAFLHQNGQTTEVAPMAGHLGAEALSIDESGAIVGWSGSSNLNACIWRKGIVELLTLPVGPSSVANDINDKNQIVGWMGVAPHPRWIGEAFLWQNGSAIALGYPKGSTNSEALAISNNGQICGRHTIPANNSAGFIRRPFLWHNGTMIDLGTWPGYDGDVNAYDINDAGQIVGDGFLWQNGTFHMLNDLFEPTPGLISVGTGYAINNAGQIVAGGQFDDGDHVSAVAVLLTPIPPLVADLTCDWQVNSEDLMEIIRNWGQCPPTPEDPTQSPPFAPPLCPTDINHDNRVSVPDLLSVINHWSP